MTAVRNAHPILRIYEISEVIEFYLFQEPLEQFFLKNHKLEPPNCNTNFDEMIKYLCKSSMYFGVAEPHVQFTSFSQYLPDIEWLTELAESNSQLDLAWYWSNYTNSGVFKFERGKLVKFIDEYELNLSFEN